jgi:hypothetical protein
LANIDSGTTSKILTAFATFIAIAVNKLGGLAGSTTKWSNGGCDLVVHFVWFSKVSGFLGKSYA